MRYRDKKPTIFPASTRAVHVEVIAREGDSIDKLIKRFSRKVIKSGVLEKYREHIYYEKPSRKRRRKKLNRKRIMNQLRIEREKI
jgi:small subunit ribosomal protein S21